MRSPWDKACPFGKTEFAIRLKGSTHFSRTPDLVGVLDVAFAREPTQVAGCETQALKRVNFNGEVPGRPAQILRVAMRIEKVCQRSAQILRGKNFCVGVGLRWLGVPTHVRCPLSSKCCEFVGRHSQIQSGAC